MTLPPLHCSTASATPFTTKTACRSRLSKLASGTVPDGRAVAADQLAAAANEERQPTDDIYSWLLLAGGPDAAAVRKHAAADRRAALADRIGRRGGEANRSKEGGDG